MPFVSITSLPRGVDSHILYVAYMSMLIDSFKTHIYTLERQNSRMSIISLCPGIVGVSVVESLSVIPLILHVFFSFSLRT